MIDFHCHLWKREYLPEEFWSAQARFFVSWAEGQGEKWTMTRVEEEIFSSYWDPEGEKTLSAMDEAGVDRAVLLPIDFGYSLGKAGVSIERQNGEVARVARAHPGRFIPFIGVDPRRKGAMDLLRRGVEEWGVRGLKYHGIGGFFPAEEQGMPLLKWAEENQLILLVHQGPLMEPFAGRFAHPSHLEPVLKEFPRLPVVAAHLAFAWWRDLIPLAGRYPSLAADISAWQLVARDNPGQFCHVLRKVLDGMGADRVLFGTDGPTFDLLLSKKAFAAFIQALARREAPPFFSKAEIRGILRENALRLLGEGSEKNRAR